MRSASVAFLWVVLGHSAILAHETAFFDDAPLRAVQFVDAKEGWAVGDDGVILHSIDGGQSWERQPSGVRSSLRSVCFLNPYTGWVAGREEGAMGQPSVGVLLTTTDGGLKWRRVALNTFPGLNCVRFRDEKNGLLAGDGVDQYPSGVFLTKDGGHSWQPASGPRVTSWLGADLSSDGGASLGGAWNRLAVLRGEKVVLADVDWFGGRSLEGIHLDKKRGVAVGQGGLVLMSDASAGATWSLADLKLSEEVRACCDFLAVHSLGRHIWIVGKPGSVILHSEDAGETWSWQKTGQNLSLHGTFFFDADHGWAVGELGTVLTTTDGGKTWKTTRQGGRRAAVLVVQARSAFLPLESIASLGGEEGYLVTSLQVASADSTSAPTCQALESQRLCWALRQIAGSSAEVLWQFPVPEYLIRAKSAEILKNWNRLHGDKAPSALMRQLVLAIRQWRPNVVISDPSMSQSDRLEIDALAGEALREAYKRAADPAQFPEQISQLGLEVWQPDKLYALVGDPKHAKVVQTLAEASPRLQAPPCEFAAKARDLLVGPGREGSTQRSYDLIESKLEGASEHRNLMQGLALAPGGEARRDLGPLPELSADVKKAWETRRNLIALARAPITPLTSPNKLLAQINPSLEGLPADIGAPAAYAVANQFAKMGQFELAQQAFLVVVDKYPAHPMAIEACRWLIRYNSSSEIRRRHELGQFLISTSVATSHSTKPGKVPDFQEMEFKDSDPKNSPTFPTVETEYKLHTQGTLLEGAASAKRWHEGCLEMEPRLATLGPLFVNDPSIQFCLNSSRRQLGQLEEALKWYAAFASKQPPGPWRDAALAELWLAKRDGQPPKPMASCRLVDTKPFLDGKLDDPCWQNGKPLVLKDQSGKSSEKYPTQVRFAYDKDFLYMAATCKHPPEAHVEPVKVRSRDAKVAPFDHLDILLDLDRDYHTYFRFQIDQRGCVSEDCWGDLSWNPRWFVALKSDAEGWTTEVAIPMVELTGDNVTLGKAWAFNVVRVVPGKGVQSWSQPADVEPRPEGMGLLMFLADPQQAASRQNAAMPKAP